MASDDPPGWLVECWILAGVCIVIVLARPALRTELRGWRAWQGDDYFSVVALICFIYQTSDFHLMPSTSGSPTKELPISPRSRYPIFEQALLLIFFCWITSISLLWSCKACVLFLYARITSGLWQINMVSCTAILLGLTWTACLFAHVFKCGRHVEINWQIKPNPGASTAGPLNMYVIGISNCVTDMIILGIMVPLLRSINLPLKKKICTYLMLCSAVFIVIVSSMRTAYSIMSVYSKGKGTDVGFALVWSTQRKFHDSCHLNVPIILTSIQRLSRTPSSWLFSVRSVGNTTGLSDSTGVSCDRERLGSQPAARRQTDTYIMHGDEEQLYEEENTNEKFEGRGEIQQVRGTESEVMGI